MTTFDTPANFLVDVKKILTLHAESGIDTYPMTPTLRQFLRSSHLRAEIPAKQAKNVAKSPAPRGARRPEGSGAVVTQSNLVNVLRQLGDCTRCALHEGRSRILFGRGNAKAELFIVGEWPNFSDDAEGNLFSGSEGDLLAKMLRAIGLDMEQVYISSVVKCRASEEKPPTSLEIVTCLPFLIAQIEVVAPKVICAMGPLAAHTLLKSKQPLVRLRGRWQQFKGVPLMATFHPSYLLKNPEMKKATWVDLQAIQNCLKK